MSSIFNINDCRICLSKSSLTDTNSVIHDKSTKFDDVMNYVIPDIDWSSKNLPSKICGACQIKLQLFMDFKVRCIQSNIIRNNYIKEHGLFFMKDTCDDDCRVSNTNGKEVAEVIVPILVNNSIILNGSVQNSEESSNPIEKSNNFFVKAEEGLSTEFKLDKEVVETTLKHEQTSTNTLEVSIDISKDIDNKNTRITLADRLSHLIQEELGEYNCFECDRPFKKVKDFKMHYKLAHEKPKAVNRSNYFMEMIKSGRRCTLPKTKPIKKPKSYACDICDKTFKNSRNLKRHKNNHKIKGDYICEICGREFYNIDILKKHLKIHQKVIYKCPHCEKQYYSNGGLVLHNQLNHSVKYKRNYLCHICGYEWVSKTALATHIQRHNKEYRFSCEVCSKKFITHGEKMKHMKRHGGKLKFFCKYCGKMYKCLEIHQRKEHAAELVECKRNNGKDEEEEEYASVNLLDHR